MADVPAEHREAAEVVRGHLVALRGGAMFLSSADVLRLLEWFDRAVPVEDILRALERAAESRAARRSRVPLTLAHARPHLGRPTRGAFRSVDRPPDVAAGLAPLVARILAQAADDPLAEALRALARDLEALTDPATRAQTAMRRVSQFHEAVFDALPEARRATLRREARAGMGDLVHLLDARDLEPLVEEAARFEARRGYAWLSAASIWDLLGPGEEPT